MHEVCITFPSETIFPTEFQTVQFGTEAIWRHTRTYAYTAALNLERIHPPKVNVED